MRALILLAALPAAAQDVEIPPDTWRKLVMGRTVHYAIDGQVWSWERYVAGSDIAYFETLDGQCLEGRWSYEAPRYCFAWEGYGRTCFRHLQRPDGSMHVQMTPPEGMGYDAQEVVKIDDRPVSCAPVPIG